MRRSRYHLAGPICRDFSPMGTQQGEAGKHIAAFVVWAALRLVMQESIVVYENSSRVPVHVLERVFGHRYIVIARIVDPAADLGWPGARKRLWGVLVLRSVVERIHCSFSNVIDLFRRNRNCSW